METKIFGRYLKAVTSSYNETRTLMAKGAYHVSREAISGHSAALLFSSDLRKVGNHLRRDVLKRRMEMRQNELVAYRSGYKQNFHQKFGERKKWGSEARSTGGSISEGEFDGGVRG